MSDAGPGQAAIDRSAIQASVDQRDRESRFGRGGGPDRYPEESHSVPKPIAVPEDRPLTGVRAIHLVGRADWPSAGVPENEQKSDGLADEGRVGKHDALVGEERRQSRLGQDYCRVRLNWQRHYRFLRVYFSLHKSQAIERCRGGQESVHDP